MKILVHGILFIGSEKFYPDQTKVYCRMDSCKLQEKKSVIEVWTWTKKETFLSFSFLTIQYFSFFCIMLPSWWKNINEATFINRRIFNKRTVLFVLWRIAFFIYVALKKNAVKNTELKETTSIWAAFILIQLLLYFPLMSDVWKVNRNILHSSE